MLMNLINWLRCKLFGHDRYLEDMGGVVYEVCTRCSWVGRNRPYRLKYRQYGPDGISFTAHDTEDGNVE